MTHNLKIKLNEEEVKLALFKYATENIDLGEKFDINDFTVLMLSGGAELELIPGKHMIKWVEPVSKWAEPGPDYAASLDDLPF